MSNAYDPTSHGGLARLAADSEKWRTRERGYFDRVCDNLRCEGLCQLQDRVRELEEEVRRLKSGDTWNESQME